MPSDARTGGAASGADPILAFPTREAWEKWLEEHHADVRGVWLKIPKKDSGIDGVDYPGALESALCFGWIDGQKKKLDERHWLQRFTPRRPGSKWSRVNRQKATELMEQGRMRPAGLREVEKAKADGRWEAAYESQSTATVPEDLRAALDAVPQARDFFATLDSRNRYAILYRIQDAKRPQTRTARIEKFVAMLAARQKLYP
ncbi:YdeI/OmpD-associated family protein [Streptomyces sp. NPDC007189]|uniref:YdeI/OmpD-associated family protein n=1 Tax=unclassified Streptomyces TaxID=2593676 RepID=UPI0033F3DC15